MVLARNDGTRVVLNLDKHSTARSAATERTDNGADGEQAGFWFQPPGARVRGDLAGLGELDVALGG